MVVYCRQYVYSHTPVLPLPVTLADILKLFRWTDGELVQVGTNVAYTDYSQSWVSQVLPRNARTYDHHASIPAGYYELCPVRYLGCSLLYSRFA